MPTAITDASSFDAMTAPSGSDIRNAASLLTSLQQAANRTRFIFDRGAPLASIAALKAIASPADGLVRFVKGYGAYVFDSASAVAEALPSVVQPTVGTGRWLSLFKSAFTDELALVKGQPSGLASLDSGGKLVEPVPNRLIAAPSAKIVANVTNATISMVDVAGLSVTLTAAVGDIIHASAFLEVSNGAAGTSTYQIAFVDGGSPVTVGAVALYTVTTTGPLFLGTMYTVTVAGSVTVKVQHAATTSTNTTARGAAATTGAQSRIHVLQYRP